MAEGPAILLVRLDGVGDAALCVPALQGLAQRYPAARFGAVCSNANARLFSQKVERVFVCESPAAADGVAAELARAGYTHVLVATEEVVGYRLARASGARYRAGFWHGMQKPFKSLWQYAQLTTRVYRPAARSPQPPHEVEMLYLLAQALGASAPAPNDPRALRVWLDAQPPAGAGTSDRCVAMQITPKLLRNGWGPAALAEFIAATICMLRLPRCVLMAAAQDESLAYAVYEQVPAATRTEDRLTLRTSLEMPRWLGDLAAAALVVTPDTGAAHVAGMLGVPVIDIFEADAFERLSQQWRPWAAPSRSLAKPRWHPEAARSLAQDVARAAHELMG
ncbi:MAG: hypothetical protein M3Z37_08005 [Candidatus Eremiobacteraeota bacterium]|nr:hypothetical protein [Candidatus Eremiobacteraeota bacterium]